MHGATGQDRCWTWTHALRHYKTLPVHHAPLATSDIHLTFCRRRRLCRCGRRGVCAGVDRMELRPDKSDLSEVLNVAWAGHEIVSDTTTQMLDWFESLER